VFGGDCFGELVLECLAVVSDVYEDLLLVIWIGFVVYEVVGDEFVD